MKRRVLLVGVDDGPDLAARAVATFLPALELPSEIHLLGPGAPVRELARSLLGAAHRPGLLDRRCRELRVPREEVVFNREMIHLLHDRGGRAVAAIDGEVDGSTLADEVVSLVAGVAGPTVAVSGLAAPGSRIMAPLLYLGLQASAGAGARFYSMVAGDRGLVAVEIPVAPLPLGSHGVRAEPFSALVASIQRAALNRREPSIVTLDCRHRVVTVGDQSVRLGPKQFFWYAALAMIPGKMLPVAELVRGVIVHSRGLALTTNTATDPDRQRLLKTLTELKQLHERLFPHEHDRFFEMLSVAFGPGVHLRSTMSRLGKTLRSGLGLLAEPYLPKGGRLSGGYRLNLPADKISLVYQPGEPTNALRSTVASRPPGSQRCAHS